MTRRYPVLVVSRDDATQDAYILALRHRRRPATGVATCEAALKLERHLRLGTIVLDVAAEEDWESCRLLRRVMGGRVSLVVVSAGVAPDRRFRRRARALGCAGFIHRSCPFPVVVDALDRVAAGESWVEWVGANC